MYYKHTKKNFDKYKNRYKYMYFKNEEKLNSCISKQWICSHEILHNGKIPNPILKKIKLNKLVKEKNDINFNIYIIFLLYIFHLEQFLAVLK